MLHIDTFRYHSWKWLTWLIWMVVMIMLASACSSQTTPQVYRVGLLSGTDAFNTTIDGFKVEMAELGYVEGENISYDFQAAGGDSEKTNQIAEKFVADEVDLILTTTTGAAKAAKAATAGTDIPVVFTIVLDPVNSGLVNEVREPGGNVTGVSRPLMGFMGKRIEFLHQMAPEVKRVWVPLWPDYSTTEITLEALRPVAQSLDLELIETPIQTADDVLAELEKHTSGPDFDAVFIMPDPITQSPASFDAILAFANQHNLPISVNAVSQTKKGALFTYADDNYETGQLAAPLANKILKGAEPATLPVVFAEPRLLVNMQTAQALGLTVEDSLLALASDVIR